MRKMTWFAGLVLSLVLTAGSTEAQAADASSGNVIHTGVYIDGIDILTKLNPDFLTPKAKGGI